MRFALSQNICFPKKFANSRPPKKSSDTVAEFKITIETEKESLNFLRII